MDPFSLQRMALRAFDVSERSVRRGRASQRRRVRNWRNRLWMICQCAFTAGLAWFVAQRLFGQPAPLFAPIAAVICLGFSFGQRLTRAVEVGVGVAVGVFFGDLFVHFFGTGTFQIVAVCLLGMSVATWLGARNLMIIQAGVQGIVILALPQGPDAGLHRWLDAIVGCVLALLVTTIAPVSSVSKPRLLAAGVLLDLANTLAAIREALTSNEPDSGEKVLERARAQQEKLDELDEAVTEGMAVVRYSPFLRRRLPHMQDLSDLVEPLDRMNRNLRVLARRSAVMLWRKEPIPPAYLELIGDVSQEVRWCAGELYERRLPTAAYDRIVAVAERSSHLRLADSLSAVVVLAQLRSIMADLLELSGVSYADARAAIPDMD